MPRPYLQYDVFTNRPLVGNQLAVFPEAAGLTTAEMQVIAREMNFPESTFVFPSEWAGTDARMRIFTPLREVPMAGHPTVGATFALAERGVIAPGTQRFIFHLNVGPTPVDLDWQGGRLAFATMTQANPVFGPEVTARAAVADAIGLTAGDLLAGAPVQEVSCGNPMLLVPLRDREAVDRAASDAGAMARFRAATGIDRPIFLFAVTSEGSAYSRMFAPQFGIPEDPATGSASGPLGCYLVRHGLVSASAARSIVSDQGVAMGRPSRIHISIGVADGVINDVRVGGEAVLVARGELLV